MVVVGFLRSLREVLREENKHLKLRCFFSGFQMFARVKKSRCKENSKFGSVLFCAQGMSTVTLAFTLPLLLIFGITIVEVFLYFRACAVVQRAAAEAGAAMTVALPGDTSGYVSGSYPNSFSQVNNKELISSDQTQTIYYQRSGGADLNAVQMPFALSTVENGPNVGTKTPGVQYLPFVTVFTCLEPLNDTSHALDDGNAATINDCGLPSRAGFLTYQIPTFLDFDKDGAEDLVFYYGQNAGQDWHIILSSTGALFRQSLRFELGSTVDVILPAPGDYDGDGRTDPAIMRANEVSIQLKVRYSTKFYKEYLHTLSAGLGSSRLRIPMVGRYQTTNSGAPQTKDRFAVVLLETTSVNFNADTDFFTTVIWPPVNTTGADPVLNDAMGRESFSAWHYKPAPGENWRPAFADHDGDGYTDIGLLTYPGGNPTAHLAGNNIGTSIDGAEAKTSPMIPWALYYPRNTNAPGLYVVERNSHRVLLINKSGILRGDDSGETVEIIVGSGSTPTDTTFVTPDPLEIGFTDTTIMSCPTCYAGGGLSDNTPASSQQVHQPTSVAGLGGSGKPLFIADYGNRRVRMVTAGADNYVNGSGDEAISTLAGGGKNPATCPALANPIPANSNCIAPCDVAGAVPAIDTACPWGCYPVATRDAGIDPRCVAVRPTALEVIADSDIAAGADKPAIFVADDRGVVYIMYAGDDNTFGTFDANELIERLAGTYGTTAASYGNAIPTGAAKTALISIPTSLSLLLSAPAALGSNSIPVGLYVASRANTNSGAGGLYGGVFRIDIGANWFRQGAANRVENISAVKAGLWNTCVTDCNERSAELGSGTTGTNPINLRIPSAIVTSSWENVSQANQFVDPLLGVFMSGWARGAGGTPYENSLIQMYLYGRYASPAVSTTFTTRWLNNRHLLSWGFRDPNPASPDEPYNAYHKSWAEALPLGTLPVQPTAGVALSPDNKYLYFSETNRGNIMVTYLDQDGDGLSDFAASSTSSCNPQANCDTYDVDQIVSVTVNSYNDGDTAANSADTGPNRDLYQFEPQAGTAARWMEVYQDARMWARGTLGAAGLLSTTTGTNVHRLEWVMDRFSAVQAVAGAPIQPKEVGPFRLLNTNTIVAPNARGSMHSTPVWTGGESLPTEMGTVNPRTSPIILGNRFPGAEEIKDESGWTDCQNWGMYDDKSNYKLNIDEVSYLAPPAGACNRVITVEAYTSTGHTVGTRRVHPARWADHGMPDIGSCPTPPCSDQVGFLDRDGTGGRNPVVYSTERATSGGNHPLMVYFGNINDCSSYPGKFAESTLSAKMTDLTGYFSGVDFTNRDWQLNCVSDRPFFTSGNVPMIAIMADYHAERTVLADVDASLDAIAVSGNRKAQDGPIAKTAYRILQDSLKVATTNSVTNPNDAQVSFSTDNQAGYTTEEITVSYVFPLNAILARLKGQNSVLITRKVKRVAHQLGQTL